MPPDSIQQAGVDWFRGLIEGGAIRRHRARTLAVAACLSHKLQHGYGSIAVVQIVDFTGLDRRSVQRSLKDLERECSIRRRAAVGGAGFLTLLHSGRPPLQSAAGSPH